MKTDVYSLSREATVEEAMRLFVEKNISAAPIVDESGEPVGFISDGDILKRLSPRSNSFTDPIVLINSTVNDDEGYATRSWRRSCRCAPAKLAPPAPSA